MTPDGKTLNLEVLRLWSTAAQVAQLPYLFRHCPYPIIGTVATCFSLTRVHKVINAPIVIKGNGALESASYSALRRISALITSSTHCFSFSARGVRVAPRPSFRASSGPPLCETISPSYFLTGRSMLYIVQTASWTALLAPVDPSSNVKHAYAIDSNGSFPSRYPK